MALTAESSSVHLTPDERSPLTASVEQHGARTVVVLRGEADVATQATMADVLSRVIAAPGRDVVVDIAGLDFIDIGSLCSIEAARQVLRSACRTLTVRSPSQTVTQLLAVLGLSQLAEPPDAA